MKRTKEQKAADRALFKQMTLLKKVDHIWYYFKWPIICGTILLALIISTIYQIITKKDPVFYLGLTNVALSSEFEESVTTAYLADTGKDPDKVEIYLYKDLYLSDDAEGEAHKTAYASKVRLMASVEKKEFDAVFMSGQAYDILSSQGYLMDLKELSAGDPALQKLLEPVLAENEVYVEDNAIEYELNVDDSHQIVSETVANAVRLDELPFFYDAGFREPFYFGLIGNTPRTQECIEYLEYLLR